MTEIRPVSRWGVWAQLLAPRPELLPLVALATIWAVAVAHYPHLPDELPGRFGLEGLPRQWIPKDWSFFSLPLAATAVYLVFRLIGAAAARRPTLRGRPFHGLAAKQVVRHLRRYLFAVKTALLLFFLNIEFRTVQVAYGQREGLGWDSYLVGGILLGLTLAGSILLYRGARYWQRWQDQRDAAEEAAERGQD
jgi:hypothetical protein